MSNFRVAGINYTVEYVPSESLGGLIGLADFNRQKVSINSDHTEQTQKLACLHEIIHIVDKAYNLKLTEEQVTYGAHALYAFLKDNTELEL